MEIAMNFDLPVTDREQTPAFLHGEACREIGW